MDHYRTGLAFDPPPYEFNGARTTAPLEMNGQADDPLGDEAAFPSTWQSLDNVEPATFD